MLRRIGGVLAVVGLCTFSMFLLNCGSTSSRPEGLLYVVSQAETYVTTFSIDLNDGDLSQLDTTSTTCKTLPSAGCGLAISMLLDPTKSTAFVLNAGLSPSSSRATVAPTIYGYTVNSDGSLSSPAVSTTLPLNDTSLAMTENAAGTQLFVIDQGSTPNPTDCTIQFNDNADCPSIQIFNAMPGSTALSLASLNHLNRMPTAISVLTFTPPNTSNTQTLLFVTSNKDFSPADNDNELSIFSVDSSGNLTEQGSSPYTTAPNPISVQAVNTNAPPQKTGGAFVYVGSQGTNTGSIGVFEGCTVIGMQGSGNTSCSQTGDLQFILLPFSIGAGDGATAMLVDPTNSFLYVASALSNEVLAYTIGTGTGTLTQIDSSPSQGTGPFALAMNVSTNVNYNFLYVSNQGSNFLGGFTASTIDGTLTSPTPTLFQPGQPSAMAAN